MTTKQNTRVAVGASGLIVACAWCCSPAQLVALKSCLSAAGQPLDVPGLLGDAERAPGRGGGRVMQHLLHLDWWATGLRQTLNFETPLLRGLHMVLLAGQPVTMRPEDVP